MRAYATIGGRLSSSIDKQKSWHGVKSASLRRYHDRQRRQRTMAQQKQKRCSVAAAASVDVDVDDNGSGICASKKAMLQTLAM
jgi:hypothetical protein